MSKLNEHEARIAIADVIIDILTDLAVDDDDDLTDVQISEIEDSLSDVAGLLLEVLQLKVVSVDGDKATCEVIIPPESTD